MMSEAEPVRATATAAIRSPTELDRGPRIYTQQTPASEHLTNLDWQYVCTHKKLAGQTHLRLTLDLLLITYVFGLLGTVA